VPNGPGRTHGIGPRRAARPPQRATVALLVAVGFLLLGGSPFFARSGSPNAAPLTVSVTPSACGGPVFLNVTATPTNGTAPLTVRFNSTVSGGCPPYEYEWEFGDEGEAEAANVTHTYSGAGTFNVLVHVHASNNVSASRSLQIVVMGGSGSFQVGVQAWPAQGSAPLEVTLWANVTGANTSGPLATNWSFGDGGLGSGSPVAHAYTTPGTYTATASVTDPYGHHASGSVPITVGSPNASPPVNLSLEVTPADGTPPLNTSVLAFSNGFAGRDALQVCFGDGPSCAGGPVGWSGITPVLFAHQYTTPGTYAISGTLTDALGSVVAGATVSVQVWPASPMLVQGDAQPLGGSSPLTVRFHAAVAGGTSPYSIQWRFGDGASGSSVPGGAVDHVYASAGTFRPTVTVTDAAGHASGIALGPISVHAAAIITGFPSQLLGIPGSYVLGLALGAAAAAVGIIEIALIRRRRRKLRKEGEQLVRGLEQRG
jgi:PKD repeat protein